MRNAKLATPMRYLVVGAGGHSRVVAELIESLGGIVTGYVGRAEDEVGRAVRGGGRIVTTDAGAIRHCESGHADHIALAIGDNRRRLAAADRLAPRLAPPLAHPSAVVSPSARMEPGTVVLAGAVISAAARVGRAGILNTSSVVDHGCRLEDGVHVSPGAVLTGEVRVGREAWIGAGATILPGVAVGPCAIVGIGSVVLDDVAAGITVAGNPARAIRNPPARASRSLERLTARDDPST